SRQHRSLVSRWETHCLRQRRCNGASVAGDVEVRGHKKCPDNTWMMLKERSEPKTQEPKCPRQELNLRTWFRRPVLYPLSYGDFIRNNTTFVNSLPFHLSPASRRIGS